MSVKTLLSLTLVRLRDHDDDDEDDDVSVQFCVCISMQRLQHVFPSTRVFFCDGLGFKSAAYRVRSLVQFVLFYLFCKPERFVDSLARWFAVSDDHVLKG